MAPGLACVPLRHFSTGEPHRKYNRQHGRDHKEQEVLDEECDVEWLVTSLDKWYIAPGEKVQGSGCKEGSGIREAMEHPVHGED